MKGPADEDAVTGVAGQEKNGEGGFVEAGYQTERKDKGGSNVGKEFLLVFGVFVDFGEREE